MVMAAAALGGGFRRFVEDPGVLLRGLVTPEQVERILPTVPQPLQPVVDVLGAARNIGQRLPGPQQITRILPTTREETAQFISDQTSPVGIGLNIAAAGLGPVVAPALRGVATAAPRVVRFPARAAAAVAEPLGQTRGGFTGFAQRALQEQGLEAAGVRAIQMGEPATQNLPTPLRIASQAALGFGGAALASRPLSAIGAPKKPNVSIEPDLGKADIAKPDASIKELSDLGNENIRTTGNPFGDINKYKREAKSYDDLDDVVLDEVQGIQQKLDLIFSPNNANKIRKNLNEFFPNNARRVGEQFSKITKYFDPSLNASTMPKKLSIVYASSLDEVRGRVRALFAEIDRFGRDHDVFESPKGYDEYGRLLEGRYKGKTVNEIAETYKKLNKDVRTRLSEQQLEYIQKLGNLDRSLTKAAKKTGLNVKLIDEEEALYATRYIAGFIDPSTGKRIDPQHTEFITTADGKEVRVIVEPLERNFSSSIKAKTPSGFQASKRRRIRTAKGAVKEGYVVAPYSDAVKLKAEQLYRRQVSSNLEDYIRKNAKDITEDPTVKVKRKSMRKTASSQSRIFEEGFIQGGKESRVFINSLQKGIADTQRVSYYFTETTLAKGLNGFNSLQRSAELAFDGSIFGIQMSHIITRDMLASLTSQAKRYTTPLGITKGKAKAPFSQKILTNFGKVMWKGLLDPKKARAFNQRLIADNIEILREMRKTELYSTREEVEFLEGALGTQLRQRRFKDSSLPLRLYGFLESAYARTAAPFQQAWTASINTAKIELYKSYRHMFTDENGVVTNAARQSEVEDYINNVTGTIASSRLGISPQQRNIENVALLAPRYTRAITGLMINAAQGGFRGAEARKAIGSMIAVFGFITSAWTLIQTGLEYGATEKGKKVAQQRLQDLWYPWKGSFFMVNVGDSLLGPGGKVISYIKQTAGMADSIVRGDASRAIQRAKRFVRGQSAGAISTGWDVISGRDYMGKKVYHFFSEDADDIGTLGLDTAQNLFSTAIPIWIQSAALEPFRERTSPGDAAGQGLAEFFGGRGYPETKSWRRDRIAQGSEYGAASWNDLDTYQKFVLEQEPEFAKYLAEQDEDDADRGSKYALYRRERNSKEFALIEDIHIHLENFLSKIPNSSQDTIYSILSELSKDISASKADKYSRLDEWKKENGIEKYTGEPTDKEFDNILNEWYALYENDAIVKKRESDGGVVAGSIDYGKLTAEQDKIKNKISPENREKLELWLNRKEGVQGVDQILSLLSPIGTKPDGKPQFRNRTQIFNEMISLLVNNPVLDQNLYSYQQIRQLAAEQ